MVGAFRVDRQKEVQPRVLTGHPAVLAERALQNGVDNRVALRAVGLAHPVDVRFKILLVQKTRERILLHRRHGGGVEAELRAVALGQALGQDHIADAQRGRERAREGVDIDHAPRAVDALQRGDGAQREAELAVVIVLDDIAALPRLRPAQQALAAADGRHRAGGKLVVRRGVQDLCAAHFQRSQAHAALIHKHGRSPCAAERVDARGLGVAGVLHAVDGLAPEQLDDEVIEVLRARADDDLLRRGGDAAEAVEMLRDGPAQRVRAVRRRGAQQRLALLAQHAAHELCPHGKGKVLRPAAAGAEIEQPRTLRLRRAPGRGAPGRGGVPLHVGDVVAALLARVEIALRLELGIGVLHRDDRRLQMACK